MLFKKQCRYEKFSSDQIENIKDLLENLGEATGIYESKRSMS